MKILVTGAAGFIGMNVCKKLLSQGHEVVGIDNLNAYYDPKLKLHRLNQLKPFERFVFKKIDIANRAVMGDLFAQEQFEQVVHLAAQAGVRHSITAPFDYVDSNLVGMMTILEGCRHHGVQHLVYASSSSVYGMNQKVPFSESDQVDNPVSLYAATKKANELMAHAYSKLYKIPTTGLRFFTVYGPAGRPDMAPWLFTEAILQGKPISVFNHGNMQRDFTYIDDIVEGVVRIQQCIPRAEIPYRICNIGNSEPVPLERFITAIETACGVKAKRISLEMQPGDVPITFADTTQLEQLVNYKPRMDIERGVANFVQWYRQYHTQCETV